MNQTHAETILSGEFSIPLWVIAVAVVLIAAVYLAVRVARMRRKEK
jgi:hypothetical protein